MYLEDEIYGKIEVDESVLVEIINSYELQRPATDFCNHLGEGDNEAAIFCKSRIVNPYVLQADGSLCRYSELDADYGAKIANLPKFKQYTIRLREDLEKLAG